MPPSRCCSAVNWTLKSELKSLPNEDAQGNVHPIRRLYACSFTRGARFVGLESILLVDPNPRQLLPPPRQLVAAPRELLLRPEQLEPRCEPLFTCPGHVLRHRSSLLPSGIRGVPRPRLLTAAL